MTMLDDARALIAEAIGRAPESVPDTAQAGSLEGWDSLAHMRLILALEARIGRTLDSAEIVGLLSLRDVAVLVAGRPH